LTSLTTFVVSADGIQDRFVLNPLRNANNIRVLPGLEMKPHALVSGRVFVGVRRFDPLNPAVQRYQGPIAAVDATFVARSLRCNIRVARDLVYSYQELQPYFLLTDLGLTITHRFTESWDAVGGGGRQKLDYSHVVPLPAGETGADPVAAGPGQNGKVKEFGAGVGYRFGRTLRLGIDGLYVERQSSDPLLGNYKGLRAGLSVTYGLRQ